MENTLVLGLGGLGSIHSLWLQRSEETRLSTVARSNYEAVKKDGVKVESKTFESGLVKFDEVYPALASGLSSSEITKPKDPFTYIVVATKALTYAKPSLVESLEPFVGPKSAIVLIQNGVGVEDEVHKRWPNNLIITCVSYVGGTQVSPGTVVHGGGVQGYFGPFHGDGSPEYSEYEKERIEKFTGMLKKSGADAQVRLSHLDIQAERWTKVAWNAAWNSFTALIDVDTTTLLNSSSYITPLIRRLVAEIASVSRAQGIEIDPLSPDALPTAKRPSGGAERLADTLINRVLRVGPLTSSMRTDVQNNRSLEVEVILGVPLRRAKEFGIDTPVLETLYSIVVAVDARISGRIKALL